VTRKASLAQRQRKRSADQARPNNRDLPNRQWIRNSYHGDTETQGKQLPLIDF